MDYGALPPEINSGRLYSGPGPESLLVAARAWNGLAAELFSAADSFQSMIADLSGTSWQGPASESMTAAATPLVAWMSATGAQAQQSATQAMAAVAAFDAAFAAVVPPAVIATNRAQLATLIATNLLGQNTPAIMANEAQYAEMWAQDASAMYGYAANSASAATLTPFASPRQATNPAGTASQAAAVTQAASTPVGTVEQELSQLVSALPQTLQRLASGGPSGLITSIVSLLNNSGFQNFLSASGEYLTFLSGVSFIISGVLFIIGPVIQIAASASSSSGGGGGGGSGAGGGSATSAAVPGLREPAASPSGSGVLAGMGRAPSIGRLSVPSSWAVPAPTARLTAAAWPGAPVAAAPLAAEAGLGPGMIGPAGLTAAAAGGGGAAGSGWAAQRKGEAAQRETAAARSDGLAGERDGAVMAPYGHRPRVLPPVAGAAAPPHVVPAPAVSARQGAAGGEALAQDVRDELNALRKQIADLAVERDVLVRSAALWAQQAMERPDR